jgi:hypothetical protein
MAREASGTLKIEALFEERLTGRGVGNDTARMPHNLTIVDALTTTGTASGQIDRVYSVKDGSVDGTGTTIDLVGTSITDALDTGLTCNFTKIKVLVITNTHATNNLLIGGSTHVLPILSGGTDHLVLAPGETFAWDFGAGGRTLTNSSTDELKLASSGSATTYSVVIAGTSA